jgi:hypothetical protein
VYFWRGQLKWATATLNDGGLLRVYRAAFDREWWTENSGGCIRAPFSPAQVYETLINSGHRSSINEIEPGVVAVTPDARVATYPYFRDQAVCENSTPW